MLSAIHFDSNKNTRDVQMQISFLIYTWKFMRLLHKKSAMKDLSKINFDFPNIIIYSYMKFTLLHEHYYMKFNFSK